MIIPVILSGGSGTRLWPLSRENYPKQLLSMIGERTMLQDTVARLEGIAELAAPMVVCNEEHRFMVAEQLRQIGRPASSIILEPVGRNTAPAIAVAAFQALRDDDDPMLLALPADHAISDADALTATIEAGLAPAEQGRLVTFGIVPDKPETGYGYIKAGRALDKAESPGQECAFSVDRFVEKPDLKTAKAYLASGGYYWNSGMFLFQASTFLEELERLAPQIHAACQKALVGAQKDIDFTRLDADAFASCPSDSIDYAVMEKTKATAVLPLAAGWSDVGSWSALWEVGKKDQCGNVIQGDVIAHDTRNCYLHGTGKLVAAIGLEDQVIVETPDAILAANMSNVQDVKEIVNSLKDRGRKEAVSHQKVFRPWGNYDIIDLSDRFQVKRITVNPGGQLSHQMHHHRAEHWIIVKGTARIVKGDEELLLSENQSTYIPVGTPHRLENPGKIPLELIEVQSGGYLGEDDIVRFDDQYGRA